MQYVLGVVVAALGVLAAALGVTADRERAALAEQGAQIEGRCQAVNQRCADKFHTAAAALRGDISAEAAADRFAEILAVEPDVVGRLRAERPGMSDREMAYRQLARSVRAAGAYRSARAEKMARDLEARADRLASAGLSPKTPVASAE